MNPGSLNPERDADIYRKVKIEGRSIYGLAKEVGLSETRLRKIIDRIESPKPERVKAVKPARRKSRAMQKPALASTAGSSGEAALARVAPPAKPLKLCRFMIEAAARSRLAEPSLKGLGASSAREYP
ncbi:hypothetical protein [Bordetella trematum]|uniref:hypothetical protein n=1 Tax=Bordetella trematum TaxID=123899 RepID=UPI0039897117